MRKVIKIIRLSIRSLLQHKLRAALSILGIICGVMAVLTMLSIGEGAKRESLNQIEQLGTKNIYIKAVSLTEEQKAKVKESRSRGLTPYDADRLVKGCQSIQDAAYLSEIKASMTAMSKDISPQIVACSPNYAQVQRLFVSQGRFITGEDINRKNLVCVIGDDAAKRLGLNGRVGNYVRIENNLFKVVGIIKRFDRKTKESSAITIRNYNEMIFVPSGMEGILNKSISSIKNASTAEITEIVIQMKTVEDVFKSSDVIRRIMEISHNGAEDYQIVIPQELLRQSQKTQRTFNFVMGSIAFISLLVGGIGIMNIMLATVSERTKEIGIRRAVGASQGHIIIQFLAESVILTFSGGLIGIAAGLGGVWLIAAMAGWKTAITALSLILPLGMSILVGIFFGLYPAYLAAKMDPIAALRYE